MFATALVTSASAAFTLLLWWYLRRRFLSISNIDALFLLNSSSASLFRLSILRAILLLWFFGLLILLISVATIFRPGSLVVDQLPSDYNETTKVYTLNVNNHGNGSVSQFFEHAMFEIDTTGRYKWVSLWQNRSRRCLFVLAGSQTFHMSSSESVRSANKRMI